MSKVLRVKNVRRNDGVLRNVGLIDRFLDENFNEETALKEENCRALRAKVRQFECHLVEGCYA
jgi:hypothetical protein